jgi:hypothetical protein
MLTCALKAAASEPAHCTCLSLSASNPSHPLKWCAASVHRGNPRTIFFHPSLFCCEDEVRRTSEFERTGEKKYEAKVRATRRRWTKVRLRPRRVTRKVLTSVREEIKTGDGMVIRFVAHKPGRREERKRREFRGNNTGRLEPNDTT